MITEECRHCHFVAYVPGGDWDAANEEMNDHYKECSAIKALASLIAKEMEKING